MSDVSVSRGPATGPDSADSHPRDLAVTGVILGVAGMAWFGWGQSAPPAGWLIPLRVGLLLCLIVAIASMVTARRARAGGSAMHDPAVRRRYFVIVGTEFALIAAGVAGLGATGQQAYLAAWILLVVGAHFIPLARVFADTGLARAGALLVLAAVAAAVTGAVSGVAPSAVAGAGGGLVCGAMALVSLARARGQAAAAAGRGLG